MENSFLRECAASLLEEYGENISDVTIMLPTRRAITFFKKELTELLDSKPIWQPKFVTVGQIMSKISSIREAPNIVLLCELYKVYSKYYDESFDKFYYWGSVMLSDFSTIDNYCCNGELLFSNTSDLKEIDERFDYLSDEQKEMILRFWSTFKNSSKLSKSQNDFMAIWNNLYTIYQTFRENLSKKGVGYSGMIYRNGAEILECGAENDYLKDKKFAIIGFNALSKSEQTLFKHLKTRCSCRFFWDSDNYYISDKVQEAGAFIRENISLFGDDNTNGERDNFEKKKKITLFDAPSEVLGCKYIGQRLEELSKNEKLRQETAIILTNENILIPLLYSIPEQIENINVTSGYPLTLSSPFHLCEAIFRFYHTTTNNRDVYYKEFIRLSNHPYIVELLEGDDKISCEDIKNEILENSRSYLSISEIATTPLLSEIFSEHKDYSSFSDGLINLFIKIADKLNDTLTLDDLEAINSVIEQTYTLKTTLEKEKLDISLPLYLSLLKKHLAATKITLEGEPLKGIQVMGILESRNIDFKNLFILSLSEDNYPSVQNIASLIPSNLREGYGLPTAANHEAMYSYYFYRLIQRAENIELIYSSYSGESLSGEASRYLHQLLIESPHKNDIKRETMALKISSIQGNEIVIEKSGKVGEKLNEFLEGKRSLSASSLYEYVECPIKFYFRTVEKISIPQEVIEEVDAAMSGTIIHSILEKIFINPTPTLAIEEALKKGYIEECVNSEIEKILNVEREQFSGAIEAKKIEISHGVRNILEFELNQNKDFRVVECESKIDCFFDYKDYKINFKGYIDRLDSVDGKLRVIDYKSGKAENKKDCASLEDIMNPEGDKKSKPIFQTLLYSKFIKKEKNCDVIPALYFARSIANENYSQLITIGSGKKKLRVGLYSYIEEEFSNHLTELLDHLFNKEIPFTQNNQDITKCTYCDYKYICQKGTKN